MNRDWQRLESEPGNVDAFARLRQELEAQGDFERLAEIYVRRANAVGGEEAFHLMLTVAEVFSARLGRTDNAVAAYRQALSSLNGAPDLDACVESLKDLFWRRGDWLQLSALREAEATDTQDAAIAADRWLDLLELRLIKSRDLIGAAAAYERAVACGVRSVADVQRDVFERVERSFPAEYRASALTELGVALLDRIGPEPAMGFFTEALTLEPDVRERITRQLQQLIERSPNDARLRDVLAELKNASARTTARTDLVNEALKAHEHGKLDDALALYERAAKTPGPLDDRVVDGLLKLFAYGHEAERVERALQALGEATGSFRPVVQLLELKLLDVESDAHEAELLYELGRILETRMGQPEAALEKYEAALALVADNVTYIAAARQLNQRLGRTEEALELYNREIASRDSDGAASLLLEKQRILEEVVGDRAGALEAAAFAFAANPGDVATAEALVADLGGDQGRESLDKLEARLAVSDPNRAAELYVAISAAYRLLAKRNRRRPDYAVLLSSANDADLKALDFEPAADIRKTALDRLRTGLAEEKRHDDLAGILARVLRMETDDGARREVILTLAELTESNLSDPASAYTSLLMAFREHPTEELFTRLQQVFEKRSAGVELEQLLRDALELAPWAHLNTNRELRAELLDMLGELLSERGDSEGAREVYLLAAAVVPNHPSAVSFFELGRASGELEATDLYKVLNEGIEFVEDGSEKADRLMRMGRIAMDEMGDANQAIAHYRAALAQPDALLSHRADARKVLGSLYRRMGNLPDLTALLQDEVEDAETDDDRRVEVLWQLADLYQLQLKEPEKAERTLEVLRELCPADALPLLRLIDIHRRNAQPTRQADAIAELILLFEKYRVTTAAELRDKGRSVGSTMASELDVDVSLDDLLLRLCKLYRHEIGDLQAAADTYERLLGSDKYGEPAFEELTILLRELEEHERLFELFERRLRGMRSSTTKLGMLREMAELADGPLGDPERAIGLWKKAAALAPEDESILLALASLYRRTERWKDLILTHNRRLNLAANDEGRAEIRCDIGDVYLHTADFSRARAAFLGALKERESHLRAHEGLVEAYRRLGDHRQLLRALGEQLNWVREPGQRHQLMVEQVDVALHDIGSARSAAEILEQLLSEHEADLVALDRLYHIHLATKAWPAAVDVLGRIAQFSTDTNARLQALLLRTRAQLVLLDDPRSAVATLTEVVELAEDNRHHHRLLAELHSRLGQFDDAIETYNQLADMVPEPEERAYYIVAAAGLYEHQLERPTDAFWCRVRAHELQPEDREHSAELDRLAARAGLWSDYLGVLRDDAERLSGEASRGVRRRMAEIVERQLGDITRAFNIWGALFREQPDDDVELAEARRLADLDPTLWTEVIALYELLIEREDDEARAARFHMAIADIQRRRLGHNVASMETLVSAWRKGLDRAAIVGLVLERAEVDQLDEERLAFDEERFVAAEDDAERAEILRGGLHVVERLGDRARLTRTLVRIFQLEPLDEVSAKRLRLLAEEDEQWPSLAELYRAAAERFHKGNDPVNCARFLVDLGLIYADKLNNVAAAIDVVVRACDAVPAADRPRVVLADIACRPGAEEALRQIARRDATEGARVRLLVGDELFRTLSSSSAGSYSFGHADRWGAHHDLATMRLAPQGEHRIRVGSRLEQSLQRQRRFTELVELLELLERTEEDNDTRVQLVLKAANLAAERLRDQDRALVAWRKSLELDPSLERSFVACRQILRDTEDWATLDELLRWVLEFAPWAHLLHAPARRAELLVELAAGLEAMDDEDRARDVYKLIASVSPNTAGVVEHFRRRAEQHGETREYAELLRRGCDELEEAQRLQRLDELARVADVLEGDVNAAIEEYRELQQEAPLGSELRSKAESRLAELFTERSDWVELARLLEMQLALSPRMPDADKLGIIARLLVIYRDRLLDAKSHARTLRRHLELAPDDIAGHVTLADLYRDIDDHKRELEVLTQLFELASKGKFRWVGLEDRILRWQDVLLRLARLHAELGNADYAVVCYSRLLATRVHRDVVIEELFALLAPVDRARLAAILDEEISRVADRAERAAFVARLADLAERSGDLPAAVAGWERARDYRPDDPAALEALTRLYEETERWAELAAICAYRFRRAPNDEARVVLLRQHARALEVLGDEQGAWEAYDEIRSRRPDDVDALEQLYAIARSRGQTELAVQLLSSWIRADDNPAVRRELMFELAEIALQQLNDESLALLTLRRAVREQVGDEAALLRLQDFHARRSHWDSVCLVQELRISNAEDDQTRLALLTEQADLHHHHSTDLTGALGALDRAMEIAPGDPGLLSRARVVLGKLGEWERLAEVLERLQAQEFDPAAKVSYLYELAGVLECHLGRDAEAFACLVQVRELGVNMLVDLPHLYRLADRASLWPDLTKVLRDDANHAESEHDRTAIQQRLVRRVEDRLLDRNEAFEIATQAALMGAEWAMDELVRLAGQDDQLWKGVVDVTRELQDAARTDAEWERLGVRVARLEEDRLLRPDLAFITTRQLWHKGARKDRHRHHLNRLVDLSGEYDELVAFNSERWQAADSVAEKIDILLENARIIDEKLDSWDRFIEQYAVAFQLDPDHPRVLKQLVQLTERDPAVWGLIINLHNVIVERAIQEHDHDRAVHFLSRLVDLHMQRGDAQIAVTTCLRLFALRPLDMIVRKRLEGLARAADRVGEVVAHYRTAADKASSDKALSFLLPAASLLADELGDEEEAILVLRSALTFDAPQRPVAVVRLETLYKKRQEYEALAGLYAQQWPPRQARSRQFDAYVEAAHVEEQGESPTAAVQFYRLALRINPDAIDVLDRLAALYERLKQWDQVLTCLERRIEASGGNVDRHMVARLARLADHYREARFSERNIEVLKRLVELCPLRRDLFERLRLTLIEGNRAKELLTVYEDRARQLARMIDDGGDEPSRQLVLTMDDITRCEHLWMLRELADLLLSGFGDKTQAIKVLGECVERNPRDMRALKKLAVLYAGLGRWPDHLVALQMQLAATRGARQKARLLRQIAEVEKNKTGRLAQAVVALEQLTVLQPRDANAQAQLGELLQRLGRLEESLASFRSAASIGGLTGLPAEQRRDLWCRMAEVYEKRDEPQAALDCYRKAISLDPSHVASRRALLKAVKTRKDSWEEHIGLLKLEIADARPAQQAELWWRIGTIYRDVGKQPRRARAAFIEALDLGADHLQALRDLADVAYHLEDFPTAAGAYARLTDGRFKRLTLESHALPSERLRILENENEPAWVTYKVRQGRSLERLGYADRARELYEEALRVRSDNKIALLATGTMAMEVGDKVAAEQKLNTLLTKHGKTLPPELVSSIARKIVPIQLARGDRETALQHLAELVKADPNDREALEMALELARFKGEPLLLADQLARLLEVVSAPTEVKALHVERGEALEEARRPYDAIADYRAALDTYQELDFGLAERIVTLELKLGRPHLARPLAQRLVAESDPTYRTEAASEHEGHDADVSPSEQDVATDSPGQPVSEDKRSVYLSLLGRALIPVDAPQALECLELAIVLDPENLGAIDTLSRLCLEAFEAVSSSEIYARVGGADATMDIGAEEPLGSLDEDVAPVDQLSVDEPATIVVEEPDEPDEAHDLEPPEDSSSRVGQAHGEVEREPGVAEVSPDPDEPEGARRQETIIEEEGAAGTHERPDDAPYMDDEILDEVEEPDLHRPPPLPPSVTRESTTRQLARSRPQNPAQLFLGRVLALADRTGRHEALPALLRRAAHLVLEHYEEAEPIAVELLLELTDINPADVEAWEQLYVLHLDDAVFNLDAAIDAMRAIIAAAGPTDDRLLELLRLYEETARDAGVPTILEVLEFCDALSSKQRRQLRAHRRGADRGPQLKLSQALYEEHVAPMETASPFARVMQFIARQAIDLLEETVDDYGASEGQDITEKRNLNIANIFRDVAELVDVPDTRVFLQRQEPSLGIIVRSDPPAIIIGNAVSQDLYNKEQRFVLARAITLTRAEFIAAATMTEDELADLLEAVLDMGSAEDSPAMSSGALHWKQRFRQILDPARTEELQARVAQVLETWPNGEDRPTAAQWQQLADTTAARVGFVACGSAALTLKCLYLIENIEPVPRSVAELAQAMAHNETLRQLVQWLLTEDAVAVRRELRL